MCIRDRVFNHTADPEAYQCNDDKESKERASGSFREEVCDTALHVAPVSYTHLDVYKRQKYNNAKVNSYLTK